MNLNDIKTLADATLMPFLKHAGLVDTDIEVKPDHEGEDSLYFTLHFQPGAELATGRLYIDAQLAVQSALQQTGDTRFPYFKFDYPDDLAPFDEEEAYART